MTELCRLCRVQALEAENARLERLYVKALEREVAQLTDRNRQLLELVKQLTTPRDHGEQ